MGSARSRPADQEQPAQQQEKPLKETKSPQEEVWDSVTKAVQEIMSSNQDMNDADMEKYALEEVTKLAKTAANAALRGIRTEKERERTTRAFDQRRQNVPEGPDETLQHAVEALQQLRNRLLFLEIARVLAGENEGRRSKFQSLRRVGDQAIVLPFTKKEVLGKGAFGIVYSAVDKNGFEFAVKQVSRRGVEAESIRKEVKFLNTLAHENIVRCYGCAGDEEYIYMFIELMQCSLDDKMTKQGKPLSMDQAKKFTKDLLNGLVYLHSKGIVHRDIKCGNVLLDSADNAKLADMGISKTHEQETLPQYEQQAGTFFWLSPEAMQQKQAGKRSDVWAVGCTVYEMIKGSPPFFDELCKRPLQIPLLLPKKILNFEHRDLVQKDDTLGPSLQNFLLRIFIKMEERPYADALLDHPWCR